MFTAVLTTRLTCSGVRGFGGSEPEWVARGGVDGRSAMMNAPRSLSPRDCKAEEYLVGSFSLNEFQDSSQGTECSGRRCTIAKSRSQVAASLNDSMTNAKSRHSNLESIA